MPATHKVALSVDPALRSFLPRIGYVLDFLSNHPNAPAGGVCWGIADHPAAEMIAINYGYTVSKSDFYIPAQGLIFQSALPAIASLVPKRYHFREYSLFSVEKSLSQGETDTPFMLPTATGSARFAFDWVETLFFHLSRLEEYQAQPQDLDEYGTLSADRQFLPFHQLHHQPVVDHLVSAIYWAIGLTPQQQPTSWTITHDIDHFCLFSPRFKLWRYLGGIAYRHRSARGWLPLLRQYAACRWQGAVDPYAILTGLFAEQTQVERVVYLAAVNAPLPPDPSYTLEAPFMRALWHRAADLGYSLGFHPSYQTWRNASLFQTELDRLQQWSGLTIRHTRQHYLRFAFPDTAAIIEQTSLTEDSTLGYWDRIGFRCGTGFSYHLYDFVHEKAYTWLEKPLVVMDMGLIYETSFNASALLKLWAEFTRSNQFGTHITVNFHNSVFFEPDIHGLPLRHLYRDLINNIVSNTHNH